MQKKTYQFSSKKVSCYFDSDCSFLDKLVDRNHSIMIMDENVYSLHQKKFKGWKTIVIRAGEKFKTQATVDYVLEQLIQMQADRKSFLIGVGGGVVTDITGFVASIYMRGVAFGFVPSTVLAMVDASIGGKNGIDIGLYKNLVGLIRQPEFLLYDSSLLRTLPEKEWINGFAEIIKHACIKDAALFRELEKNNVVFYRKNKAVLSKLIRRNVMIKSAIVQKDEFEKNERRLLNFGHTLGHAIENLYQMPHGHAISVGMVAAALLSEEFNGFKDTGRMTGLLEKYGLPTRVDFDFRKAFELIRLDKKKEQRSINYVLLKQIGQGTVKAVPFKELEKMIYSIERAR
jgi:shikimate kinase / 3-dehydroquinate synthase